MRGSVRKISGQTAGSRRPVLKLYILIRGFQALPQICPQNPTVCRNTTQYQQRDVFPTLQT